MVWTQKEIKLARWLHENYEREAGRIGWETNKKCQTDFDYLPLANRLVMLNIARKLIQKFELYSFLR